MNNHLSYFHSNGAHHSMGYQLNKPDLRREVRNLIVVTQIVLLLLNNDIESLYVFLLSRTDGG